MSVHYWMVGLTKGAQLGPYISTPYGLILQHTTPHLFRASVSGFKRTAWEIDFSASVLFKALLTLFGAVQWAKANHKIRLRWIPIEQIGGHFYNNLLWYFCSLILTNLPFSMSSIPIILNNFSFLNGFCIIFHLSRVLSSSGLLCLFLQDSINIYVQLCVTENKNDSGLNKTDRCLLHSEYHLRPYSYFLFPCYFTIPMEFSLLIFSRMSHPHFHIPDNITWGK